MTSLKILIITILFLITGFYVIHGQEKGYLAGVVKKKASGEPLIGAHVVMKQDRSIGAVTDHEGQFFFSLDQGYYTFTVSFTSMKSDTFSVKIAAGQTVSKTIELLPFSVVFDEIEIRAGKFEKSIDELNLSIEVIKPELIESKNTRNIETILDYTPGLNILDGEAQIRGGSGFTFGVGSKVALFLDDMPLLSGDACRPEWAFVPVENIEQVEVIKGASSVLSGASALSGAIYIRTAYPRLEPLTKINIYSGIYSTPKEKFMKWWSDYPYITGVNFIHSRQVDNFDLVIGGDINFDHGYIGAPRPGPDVKDTITNFTDKQMAHRKARLNFNLRRRSAKHQGLNYGLNGNFMLNKTNMVIAWLDDSAGFYRAYPGGVILQDIFIFYVDPFINFYSTLGVKHSLKARILYKDNQMNNNQSTKSTDIYGNYQFRKDYTNIKGLQLILGTSAQYSIVHASMYEGSGSPDNNLMNISGYAEIEKKIRNTLNFSIGVRGEYYKLNDSITDFKPIIRVGVSFKLMQETNLRASFGQGYRFPTIAERFIRTSVGTFGVYDNPYLKPETSWNAEIGIRQGFKFSRYYGFLDIAGFWQEYKNTIEYLFGFWEPPSEILAGFKFINTGKSEILGLDISLYGQAEINKDTRLNTMFGYNYIMPTTLEPDYVFATDYQNIEYSYESTSIDPSQNILKYRFLHSVKADIELKYKNFSIGYSLKFFSKIINLDKTIAEFEKATVSTQGSLQPVKYMDYFYHHNNGNVIMDVRFSYEFLAFHKIAFISNNFLNRTYSLRPLKAEPVRTIILQYTFRM